MTTGVDCLSADLAHQAAIDEVVSNRVRSEGRETVLVQPKICCMATLTQHRPADSDLQERQRSPCQKLALVLTSMTHPCLCDLIGPTTVRAGPMCPGAVKVGCVAFGRGIGTGTNYRPRPRSAAAARLPDVGQCRRDSGRGFAAAAFDQRIVPIARQFEHDPQTVGDPLAGGQQQAPLGHRAHA